MHRIVPTIALWMGVAGIACAGGAPRIPGAGVQTQGLETYGCPTATPPSGWTIRYVAPNGAGSGAAGSPSGSITAALQSAGGGAVVICVAAGQYVENVQLGTNRRLVLAGGFAADFATRAPAATPSRVQPANAAVPTMSATAPRDLTIDGFEITGSARRGIDVSLWDSAPPSAERVTLLNNHVHHNGGTTGAGGTDATGGIALGGGSYTDIVVAHNLIEQNDGWHHGGGLSIAGDHGNALLRNGANDGFGTLSQQAPGLATIAYNIVRDNRIHEPSLPHGAGIAVGMNAIVDHNEIVGNDTTGDGDHYGVGGGLIAQHGTSGDTTGALVVVQHNWFERNRAGKAGSAVFLDQTHAGYVIGNVIVDNEGPGAVLVDGACGQACAGPNGDHDRNFVTLVHNTIADNDGAGLYVQDSTAHLFFNLLWNNAAPDDIRLAAGSPGADAIVRGRDNMLRTSASGLTGTIDPGNASGSFDGDYRLLSDRSNGMPLWSDAPGFVPAFVFAGSLYADTVRAADIDGTARRRDGDTWLWGAYAQVAGEHAPMPVFADGFEP